MALPTKEEEVILEVVNLFLKKSDFHGLYLPYLNLSCLKKFRGKVADVLTEEEVKDEMFLLRWLRARDLNLEKAEHMLRNAKKWRIEQNLDHPELRPKANPRLYELYPLWMDGFDKEGRPVVSVLFGKWDRRKATKDELFVYFTEVLETVMKGIKDASRIKKENDINGELNVSPVTQITLIFDWEGFAFSQLLHLKSAQNFVQAPSIYEAYYPEIVYKMFFVNCPSMISLPLRVIKAVMAPKTAGKIVCFGSDREQWTNELLQYIDKDQLPSRFGGTKEHDRAENTIC